MKKDEKSMLAKVLLIGAMLVVAAVGLWGVIRLLPNAFSSIANVTTGLSSSIFKPKENIVISLSKDAVDSGEEISISYEHKNKKDNGKYFLRYECNGRDVTFVITDTSRKNLKCGDKMEITSNPFVVSPILNEKNSFADIQIYLDFVKDNSLVASISGRSLITLRNGGNTVAIKTATSTSAVATSTNIIKSSATKSSSTKSSVVKTATSTSYIKKPDLYIESKSLGIIQNGVFVAKSTFGDFESPVIKFVVGNEGNMNSGSWYFTSPLPTSPAQNFVSPAQPSLAPGESIEFTLSIANLAKSGDNTLVITVDPTNSISEVSENNNALSLVIKKTGTVISNTGKADLLGSIIARGYIDRYTGTFYEANSVPQNSQAGIKFSITNNGGVDSGNFVFRADLPSNVNNTYTSPTIPSIAPGQTRTFTIGFDSLRYTGNNTVTIRIDSNSNVSESNESNNTITTSIQTY